MSKISVDHLRAGNPAPVTGFLRPYRYRDRTEILAVARALATPGHGKQGDGCQKHKLIGTFHNGSSLVIVLPIEAKVVRVECDGNTHNGVFRLAVVRVYILRQMMC